MFARPGLAPPAGTGAWILTLLNEASLGQAAYDERSSGTAGALVVCRAG